MRNDTRYWQLGAKISKTTSGFESFYLDWTTEAIKYQPNDTQLQFAHLESLMLSNHWSRAANMSSEFLLEPQSAEHWGIHYLLCLYHGMMPKGLKMVEEQNVSRYFVAVTVVLSSLGMRKVFGKFMNIYHWPNNIYLQLLGLLSELWKKFNRYLSPSLFRRFCHADMSACYTLALLTVVL